MRRSNGSSAARVSRTRGGAATQRLHCCLVPRTRVQRRHRSRTIANLVTLRGAHDPVRARSSGARLLRLAQSSHRCQTSRIQLRPSSARAQRGNAEGANTAPRRPRPVHASAGPLGSSGKSQPASSNHSPEAIIFHTGCELRSRRIARSLVVFPFSRLPSVAFASSPWLQLSPRATRATSQARKRAGRAAPPA